MSNDTLGHYTSPAGLIGIVQGTMWATNIQYLNDDQEFKHAVELIRKIIQKSLIPKGHPNFEKKEDFVKDLSAKLNSFESIYSEYIYTTSFSEKTDLLSQWRGYCPGNNGYCLEIVAADLLAAVQKQFPQAQLLKCVYDDSEKEKQIKEILNKHWHRYARGSKPAKTFIDELTPEMLILASHFKHSSFAEEAEHRIVVELDGIDQRVKFRPGKYSLVPYIELPVQKELIKSICIGPTPRPTPHASIMRP